MLIDLHTHTTVSSSFSVMSPEGLMEAVRQERLYGACVTDHCSIEGVNVTQGWAGRGMGVRTGVPVARDRSRTAG